MPLTDRPIDVLINLGWYTEGPVMDADGNLYFTTMKGGWILKIDVNGRLSDWAVAKCPNGQIILADGHHLICDSGLATITRFARDGSFMGHDIKGACDGKKVYAPNDLVADAEGGIYFTDSIREQGKVCYYKPGGTQRIIAHNLDFPNGIALSKDEKLLFVAESYQNRILVFTLEASGMPKGNYSVFANLPSHPSGNMLNNLPDGIKTDALGRLWIAHYGMQAIQVLSPQGQLIDSIPTKLSLTSNLYLNGECMIVTGGHGEPGPGAVLRIHL